MRGELTGGRGGGRSGEQLALGRELLEDTPGLRRDLRVRFRTPVEQDFEQLPAEHGADHAHSSRRARPRMISRWIAPRLALTSDVLLDSIKHHAHDN
jgi:hypothetical protein